ncbi:MAG: S8 family serine peptidase, partial [Clostridia bacterium]|nr:S8 family serine peptidase [Clostridia bacterium]
TYTKEDIAELIKDIHASSSAEKVYKNEKIPFAFDYYYGDGNVMPGDYSKNMINHGTHVAGIVGGKNGTHENSAINGIAPDCQLLLMKIASDDVENMPLDKLIAAMEDAVELGADVINCSVGIDYASPASLAKIDEIFSNAYNAGVFVAASAGNMSRGFNKNAPLTTNIDYSASGVPAAFSQAVSVGAVNKNYAGKMFSVSSYGVTENLELKPDITAPGGNGIISSYKDGSYDAMSGTSMASPHIAGAAAVICEYLERENISYASGKPMFIQNLMMSTAVPTSSGSVPYSPRLQGAGVVNLKNAISTRVILTGDDGKSKISLGDELTKSFDIKFTISNFGTESITYDKISLSVLTDSYTQSGDKYYVGASKLLDNISHNLPQEISVNANSGVEIRARIELDDEEIKAIEEVFTNGFYIDGFVRLESGDSSVPGVGIPFTGFYGDWTKASVYDNTVYYDEESYFINNGIYEVYDTALFTWVKKGNNDDILFLGSDGDDGFDKKYIALSPNSDGMCDDINILFTPMRSISYISSEVINQDGNVVSGIQGNSFFNKFNSVALKLNDILTLSDGDYNLRLTSLYNYQKENPTKHILEFPFYVDTIVPEIIKLVPNGNVVDVTFRDNRHMSYVYCSYKDENGKVYNGGKSIIKPEDGGEITVSFNLSKLYEQNAKYNDIYIYAYDKAGNCYKNTMSSLMGDIHPEMTNFSYTNGRINVDFNLTSYKSKESCTAMLAFYDESGSLVYLDSVNNFNLKQGKSDIKFEITDAVFEVTQCKLFFWNGIDDITPVDISKTFSVSTD